MSTVFRLSFISYAFIRKSVLKNDVRIFPCISIHFYEVTRVFGNEKEALWEIAWVSDANSNIMQGRREALIVSADSPGGPRLLTPVFKMTNLFSPDYRSGQAKASSDRSNYSGWPQGYHSQEVSSPPLRYCVGHVTWFRPRRADWWTGSNYIKLTTSTVTWTSICQLTLHGFKLFLASFLREEA